MYNIKITIAGKQEEVDVITFVQLLEDALYRNSTIPEDTLINLSFFATEIIRTISKEVTKRAEADTKMDAYRKTLANKLDDISSLLLR
jgi:hypothetical protein